MKKQIHSFKKKMTAFILPAAMLLPSASLPVWSRTVRQAKLIFLLFILSFPLSLSAQKKQGQAVIDSLLNELPKAKEDTNKAKLLGGISFEYRKFNPDEGIKYGTDGLALSEKLGWKNGIALGANSVGACYMYKSDFTNALEYFFRALKLNEDLGLKKGISANLGNIGIIYLNQGEYNKASEYILKDLAIDEELKDTGSIAKDLNDLGLVNHYQGNYSHALDFFFQAIKISERINRKDMETSILCDIGLVYMEEMDYNKALEYYYKSMEIGRQTGDSQIIFRDLNNIGLTYLYELDYSKAEEYFKKCLSLSEKLNNKYGMAGSLGNLANVYRSKKDYKNALAYYQKSGKLDEEIGDKRDLAQFQLNMGAVYMEIAKDSSETTALRRDGLQKAIGYLSNAIKMHSEMKDLKGLVEDYTTISDAWLLYGNYMLALENYKQYIFYKDSVFSSDSKTKITNLETQRDLDLKDRDIQIKNKQIEIDKLAVAKKRNERVFYLSGIGVMLIVIIVIVRNNKQLSAEKQKSEGLLLNILPSEVAEELKQKGTAAARQYDEVTVLFTDFVDFTKAGERMTPKQLVGELHACFKAFDTILGKYNIEKIKTVGDAYLAVSGLPATNPRHAADVVAAAIEITDFMLQRETQLGNATFAIRIGINSGSVVAGIVGVKKFAYDIWGDTVNTAARMEQNSEAGKINISETTYELVKDKFRCEYRGEIDAKNKGKLRMYFVSAAMA